MTAFASSATRREMLSTLNCKDNKLILIAVQKPNNKALHPEGMERFTIFHFSIIERYDLRNYG
jgi:hypothetical protein